MKFEKISIVNYSEEQNEIFNDIKVKMIPI